MSLRSNRYEGKCAVCALTVPPYSGTIAKASGQGFRTYCHAHEADGQRYAAAGGVAVQRVVTAEEQAEQAADTMTAPEPVKLDADAIVAKIAKLASDYATQDVKSQVDAGLTQVASLVAAEFAKLAPRELLVKAGSAPKVLIKQYHKALPTVLTAVAAGSCPFLVGPAGSGKTTLGMQVAEALGRKFYMAARVTSEFKLIGFIDAKGQCVRTPFREAYEHGGGFLFDEVDASDPDAMTTFNAALANGVCDFPDGLVKQHKNFCALAAGNTFGRGADRQYVGRNQLDAATLDRFDIFEVEYDEELELALAGNDDWAKWVQKVRKAVEVEKVRHIVSPRASIRGAKLLAAGMERQTVEEATVWKGLPTTERSRIQSRMLSV